MDIYIKRMSAAAIIELFVIAGLLVTGGVRPLAYAFLIIFVVAGIYGAINFDKWMRSSER